MITNDFPPNLFKVWRDLQTGKAMERIIRSYPDL